MESKNKTYRGYKCHLCRSRAVRLFFAGGKASGYRDFLHCSSCDLIFVPKKFFLTGEAEEVSYLQHNNDAGDPDYRAFLGRLYYKLKPNLKPGAKGLDYGAGPGPALAQMMKEDGFDIRIYDPFFYPDETALKETYDFITCTETAEHFREPLKEFDRLDAMLEHDGWLGLMTGMLDSWKDFPAWYYHRDPTHICFYSQDTMRWIASRYSWKADFPCQNVVLFQKASPR